MLLVMEELEHRAELNGYKLKELERYNVREVMQRCLTEVINQIRFFTDDTACESETWLYSNPAIKAVGGMIMLSDVDRQVYGLFWHDGRGVIQKYTLGSWNDIIEIARKEVAAISSWYEEAVEDAGVQPLEITHDAEIGSYSIIAGVDYSDEYRYRVQVWDDTAQLTLAVQGTDQDEVEDSYYALLTLYHDREQKRRERESI